MNISLRKKWIQKLHHKLNKVAVYYIPQEEETVHRKGSIANSFKRKSLYDLEQEEEVTCRLKKKKEKNTNDVRYFVPVERPSLKYAIRRWIK